MKTRISQLAVAVVFALFIGLGNVNATEKEAKASSHENIEPALEFENWMMDENVWKTTTIQFEEAREADLTMEYWMTNDAIWEVQNQGLAFESWMFNESIWEVQEIPAVETEKEDSLAMEQWMVNDTIWNI